MTSSMNIHNFRMMGGAAFHLGLAALAIAQEASRGDPAATEVRESEPVAGLTADRRAARS